MKFLVFGVGVIGSFIAHKLIENGNDVTVVARNENKRNIEANGIRIYHYVQKNETVDRCKVIDSLDDSYYDAIFVCMQYIQVKAILPELAKSNTKLLVLVGNNMDASGVEKSIKKLDNTKEVLFAFSSTGGRKEKGKIISVRKGNKSMTIGGALSEVSESARKIIDSTKSSDFIPEYMDNMDSWLKYHAGFILPIAYLGYICNCNLRASKKKQRKLTIDAIYDYYRVLIDLGYPVRPIGDDKYYKGAKRIFMKLFMFSLAKTNLGALAVTDHCRVATKEMEALSGEINTLKSKSSIKTPYLDKLLAMMPSFSDLHEIYRRD